MHVPRPLRVLLVHPGGPFWRGKDRGAWSIPKGLPAPGEAPLDAARREFHEETGLTARGAFLELEPLKQKGGKLVRCWAFAGDAAAPAAPGASTFEIEWPPRSGRLVVFPEVDAVSLFDAEEARRKILPGQAGFITELIDRLAKAAGS